MVRLAYVYLGFALMGFRNDRSRVEGLIGLGLMGKGFDDLMFQI